LYKQGHVLPWVGRPWAGCAYALIFVSSMLVLGAGCTRETATEEPLIRVGSLTLTLAEFNQEVRAAAEEAFPGETEIEFALISDLRKRVLNQLGEEMMLAAYASDHGIELTPEELDRSLAAIKADYPDDTFEETLLENAISFEVWQRQLAARLLAEKVIEREVVDKVRITSGDITDYYKTYYPMGMPATEDADEINQRIVTHLRRQKAESAYKEWMTALRKAYPVEINREVWDRWMGSDL
jgi:hypothetical protein